MSQKDDFKRSEKNAYRFVILFFSLMIVFILGSVIQLTTNLKSNNTTKASQEVEGNSKINSGPSLIKAKGYKTVVNNCTGCHSSKIILQNRMTADGWNSTIKWMQETQNLWDLGDNQEIIVNYLVTNYPILDKGRRENLSEIEWYELEN